MKTETRILANWGNFPRLRAQISSPDTIDEIQQIVSQSEKMIARGNGKCYGDAALAPKVVSLLNLNRILFFDPKTGIIECESGAMLADLLQVIVPAGWFFHVTPGIKNITVGGAIACDVHGKNHPAKGCFSNWLLSFRIMQADGTVVECSKSENARLFWETCGGMGWTGVILSAKFQLMPVSSIEMRQKAIRADNLEGLFQAFDKHQDWTYAAAWVDCLATGSNLGRGVLYLAEHQTDNASGTTLEYPFRKARNVPFYAPSWLLNRLSIRAHNHILFSKASDAEQTVDMDRYFYPLDRIQNWNRLYGSRGFIQYQFCLPEKNSLAGIKAILGLIKKSRDLPFLSVLKRHGERPAEAVHSFPIKGYSLALDFPRTRTIFSLVEKMDTCVWDFGGKIYLAKDACSAGKMGRLDPAAFGEAKFNSTMRERLTL
ncbi:MAG: FAD-binding oxidoreductase [Bacteroidetes bacterium]|nr:MAG: FAD-binding oxidoreductase [Bacteroidota bacterium]